MKDIMKNEKTVTLTREEWCKLTTYILMTTQYRKGELEAWERLSQEKEEDGTPTFKNAESNAEFWRGMIEMIEAIRIKIDKD